MKKIILLSMVLFAIVSCENQDASIAESKEESAIASKNLTTSEEIGEELFNSIFLLEGDYVEQIEFVQEQKTAYMAIPANERNMLDSINLTYKNLIQSYIADNEPNFYTDFGTDMLSKDAYIMTDAYKNASDIVFNAVKGQLLEDVKDFIEQCISNQVPMELFEATDFNNVEDIISLKNKLEEDYNIINGKSVNILFNIDKNFVYSKSKMVNEVWDINEVASVNKNALVNKNMNIIFIEEVSIREKLILDIYNAL